MSTKLAFPVRANRQLCETDDEICEGRRQEQALKQATRPAPARLAGSRLPFRAVNTLACSSLFALLSSEDIARLNVRCVWRRVRAGEYLPDEAADGYALSVATNGRFRALRICNGREIIMRDIN